MSSKAAYFPDSLAGAKDKRGAVRGEAESLPHPVHEEQKIASDMLAGVSDERLLEQVPDGAKEALGTLFRRHARAIRNVACRILRDESEADDLVQEVFLFIFRKASLFNAAHGNARSWIFQVAYHRAFDRRRYLNARHFYNSEEIEKAGRQLADPRAEPRCNEMSIETIYGRLLTTRFNARLTPEQRGTLELFFFEGYTLKEIAQLTGRSVVNVRSHYYRGIERLRKFVLRENLRSK